MNKYDFETHEPFIGEGETDAYNSGTTFLFVSENVLRENESRGEMYTSEIYYTEPYKLGKYNQRLLVARTSVRNNLTRDVSFRIYPIVYPYISEIYFTEFQFLA